MDHIGGALNSVFEPIKNFAHDVELFKKEENPEIQNLRGISLALKVGGVFFGIAAAAAVVYGMVGLVTLSPGVVLINGIAFTINAVISHDLLKFSSNTETAIQKYNQQKEPTVFDQACQTLQAIWDKIRQNVQPESNDPFDFLLKDTIVFGTIYHLFIAQPEQSVQHPHTN